MNGEIGMLSTDTRTQRSLGGSRRHQLLSVLIVTLGFVACAVSTGCGRSALLEEARLLDEIDCGNGAVDASEGCDDGNPVNGDGCSAHCQLEPVAVYCGSSHNCALGPNGKLICWGRNEHGVLGLGDTEPRADEPSELGRALLAVDLGDRARVTSMATSYTHACAVLDGGRLKCWGYNANGMLGLGDSLDRGDEPDEMGDALPDVDIGSEQSVLQVAAGSDSTCVLLASGQVKCWGDNRWGDLGLPERRVYGTAPGDMGDALPTIDLGSDVSVKQLVGSPSADRSCALLDDGSVKCWGDNSSFGELGLGDAESRGDDPNELGDHLARVQLGTHLKVASAAMGQSHTCILSSTGAVKCWGNSAHGELGTGSRQTRGRTPEGMGDNLPAVDLGHNQRAVAIAAGVSFSCAILENSRVKCWGQNLGGQLGLGDKVDRGLAASDMGEHLPEVDLGSGRTALSLCAAHQHACVLRDDRTIVCWGGTADGALGDGNDGRSPNGRYAMDSSGAVGDEPNEMGDRLSVVELYF